MGKAPRVRRYSLTYPKCPISKERAGEILKALPGAKHVVVAEEKHKDGEQHLHAYVHFDAQKTRPTELFDLEGLHGNVQACRSTKDWIRYITKEDPNPWQHNFDVSACLKKKKATFSVADAAKLSLEELAKVTRAEILQRTLQGIQLYKAMTADIEDLPEPCGIWVFGKPGVGKSRDVRVYCKRKGLTIYDKAHNKWWDGYAGEEVVLIDDLHPDSRNWVTHFLKIWADQYVFKAEVKGAMFDIRPKWVIITSNYNIYRFAEESEDLAALQRRMRFLEAEKFEDTYMFLQETIGWCDIPATPPPSNPEPPSPSELDRIF